MSNTYGSIHIKTEQSEQVVQMLLAAYKNQPDPYEKYLDEAKRHNVWLSSNMKSFARECFERNCENFLVIIADGWVSFYDEQMSFEEVTQKARSFAKKVQEPIIYMSSFDGDVYVFGLIEDGKTKTSGRAVVDPEVYAMTEKQAKMAEFYRVADVPMPEKRMKMPSDVTELEELLASIMPVPLIVYDENDFDDLADEYELIEEVKGIRVFKVKYKK